MNYLQSIAASLNICTSKPDIQHCNGLTNLFHSKGSSQNNTIQHNTSGSFVDTSILPPVFNGTFRHSSSSSYYKEISHVHLLSRRFTFRWSSVTSKCNKKLLQHVNNRSQHKRDCILDISYSSHQLLQIHGSYAYILTINLVRYQFSIMC